MLAQWDKAKKKAKKVVDSIWKKKSEESGDDITVDISNVAGATSLFKIVPEIEIGMLVTPNYTTIWTL